MQVGRPSYPCKGSALCLLAKGPAPAGSQVLRGWALVLDGRLGSGALVASTGWHCALPGGGAVELRSRKSAERGGEGSWCHVGWQGCVGGGDGAQQGVSVGQAATAGGIPANQESKRQWVQLVRALRRYCKTAHPPALCTHQLQIASQQEYWALAVWVEQVVAMNWVRYPQLLCRAAAALRFRAAEGLRCQPLAGSFFMWMYSPKALPAGRGRAHIGQPQEQAGTRC